MEKKLYSLRGGLKKARKKRGISQEKLSQLMGVTLKTVMNWEQGISNPDLETLIRLSEVLNCDLDYLVGTLEESSHDIHFISEYTGLSEAAIEIISAPDLGNPFGKTLSHLIESKRFYNLITTYKIFLVFLNQLNEKDLNDSLPWKELNDETVVLGINQAVQHFKQEVALAMNDICEDDYTSQVLKVKTGGD